MAEVGSWNAGTPSALLVIGVTDLTGGGWYLTTYTFYWALYDGLYGGLAMLTTVSWGSTLL